MTTMVSAVPLLQTRSTLEDMLVSLLRKEELPMNLEMMPPLPARPNSKARPPTRRSLPAIFNCKIKSTSKMKNELTPAVNRIKTIQMQESSSPDPYEVSINSSTNKIVKAYKDNLLPANPDCLDLVEDLMLLSYLNELSVLHTVKRRYSNDLAYTKGGPFLISLKKRKNAENAQMYSMINAAYNDMMRGGRNQSIVISGESGAGKTEEARKAVHCLCTLGGENKIKNKIKYADVVLEAFGNAKTLANYNSSTFGKLTKVHFNSEGKLSGIEVQTLPLEKGRVTNVIDGERSYHVLYELCFAASTSLKNKLKLKSVNEYNYLSKSEEINGADESAKFKSLTEAFDALEISKDEQYQAFEVLSAILWIGNISYEAAKNGNYVNVLEDEAVSNSSSLLSCSAGDLITCVSTQNMKVGKVNVLKKLTLPEATAKRNALASFLYTWLFRWLVERINQSLQCEKENVNSSISVLDICGFRDNKLNTFDTCCINYANERLHQHFLRHLIKLPQQEYEDEKLDCIKVNFKDNKECLDLFEKRNGLLSLMGLESSSTDLKLAEKLDQLFSDNFRSDGGRIFHLQHFGGRISYDTYSFLESNLDLFNSDFVDFLSSCKSLLLSNFASNDLFGTKSTFSGKFQGEVFELVRFLEKTTQHFVICVKPNDDLLSDLLKDDVVLRQLRQCGIVEVLRASRCGFQTRWSHREFSARYGHLAVESNKDREPLSLCIAVLLRFNIPPSLYHVGYSKIFLRTGTIEILEEKHKLLQKSAVRIQKFCRGSLARRRFRSIKIKATLLQSYIRGGIERTRYSSLVKKSSKLPDKQLQSIVLLQSVIRRWLVRRKHVAFATASERFLLDQLSEPKLDNCTAVGELKRKLTKAVEENARLRVALESYDRKCTESEVHVASPSPGMIPRLEREFEEARVGLEDAADAVGAVEELRTLKLRFRSWKREFKMRLKETKARLRRISHGDSSRSYLRWWGKPRSHS